MEKFNIVIPELQKKIEGYKKESTELQSESDSYLDELKTTLTNKDLYTHLIDNNPDDIELQKKLQQFQLKIYELHEKMNDLSIKKVDTNETTEAYEKVEQNKKNIRKQEIITISKESLN